MSFSFGDLQKKVIKKDIPLEEQKGTRFDPPKKEVISVNKKKGTINVAKEKSSNRIKSKGLGESVKPMGKNKVPKETVENIKENPNRKADYEQFKSELGIEEKEMVFKFIQDCIDEVHSTMIKLENIKGRAKKFFKG